MADESATAPVYVYPKVTEDDFYAVSLLCQDFTWLVRYSMPNVKASDIVAKFTEFYSGVENATLAVDEFVEFSGASPADVDTLYTFYGGGEMVAASTIYANDLIPLFEHPVQDSDSFIGIFVFLTVIGLLTLALRLYSRKVISGYIRAYDWVLVSATILTFGFGVMNATSLAGPFHFRGYWDRTWAGYDYGNSVGIASDVLYPTVVLLIKTSLLWFYWTLTPYWPLRVSVIVTWVIVFANSMCMIFIWVFKSDPVLNWKDDAYWNATLKFGPEDWKKSELICGGINIATDILVWVLPLPMIWKIRQSGRERFLTCATFGVGALACIACGIRLYSLQEIQQSGSLVPSNATPYLLWTMTELYLAIICSSVPALRAILLRKAPTVLGITSSSESFDDKYDNSDLSREKNNIRHMVKPGSPTDSSHA